MRRTRRLILLVILVIAVSVGVTWNLQKSAQQRHAPRRPERLPDNIAARADEGWTWEHRVGSQARVQVFAQDFQQIAQPSKYELRGVELRIFDEKKPDTFHKVTSARADFDIGDGVLFSEGEVEITMGVQGDNAVPAGRLLKIRSSGVRLESKTGKVSTDRPAFFTFDNGDGQSTGADYDSNSRELRLHKDVVINWRGGKPSDAPMQVTAGTLFYKEAEAKIFLSPWAKLTRETFTLEGGDSVVTLADGVIQLVETRKASGSDKAPARTVEYGADHMRVEFNPAGQINKVTGEPAARLASTSTTARTDVTARKIELFFDVTGKESTLRRADSNGGSLVESKPLPRPGAPLPDTRVMRAETIEMTMRPGGQEIEKVLTHSPGTVEFIPNRPGGRRRHMAADRMWINYGRENRVDTFRAVAVATRTEQEAPKGKPAPPPALTWSRDLNASFDPKTGDMARLEQWNDFRYEEGDRRARAEKAVLESLSEVITLEGRARIWDPTGSTDADTIVVNQRTGSTTATGNVASTRVPEQAKDKKQKQGASPMMSGSEAVQARAARMTTSERNQRIRYEGGAVLWQGADRITADRIDIDRATQRLEARGSVVTQLLDRSAKEKTPGKKAAQVFTTVRAPELDWTDKERLAHYRGGVTLTRAALRVDSRELRAWMNDSTLEKAFADGAVRVFESEGGRTRTGTAEHAEYYLAEEKMILSGGDPRFVDSVKGATRGRQLTWFARNDRLLVDGAEGQPAITNLRRK